jgi:hypothetical protein
MCCLLAYVINNATKGNDMIEAHYTTGKQPTLCLATTTNGQRAWLTVGIKVAGKREARKVAAVHGATPWNF